MIYNISPDKMEPNVKYLPEGKFIAFDGNMSERQFTKNDGYFIFNKSVPDIDNGLLKCSITWMGKEYYSVVSKMCTVKPAMSYDDIKDRIILIHKTGSHAYGTNIETSDTDYRAVFIHTDKIYNSIDFDPDWEEFKEKSPQDDTETTYYDLRKFIRLAYTNNPNILESFNISDDCIVYKHQVFDLITSKVDKFVTKDCYSRFLGYAEQQIQKSRGQNKMQNWEKTKMERKGVIDFCYVPHNQGSIPLLDWLSISNIDEKQCGLVSIPHMKDTYSLFCGESYKGIVSGPDANDVQLSSVEKNAAPFKIMTFNKDAYSQHCRDYKRYQTWQKEKNPQRWIDVKKHDQKIDGKNMLHCVRLIMMSEDIALGKGIVVRRPEAEYLKKIRKGDMSLEELIDWSENKLEELKELFEKSGLPNSVDPHMCENLFLICQSTFKKYKEYEVIK